MGILSIFKKKSEENPMERIDDFIDKITNARYVIESNVRMLEKSIAKYFKKNRIPPPVLLTGWKTFILMRKSIDGAVEAAKVAKMQLDVQKEISDAMAALNTKELQGVFNLLNQSWNMVQKQMSQLIQMQGQIVRLSQNVRENMNQRLEVLEEEVSDIQSEAMEAFGESIIELMRVESPELYNLLPEDLKKKMTSKNSSNQLNV